MNLEDFQRQLSKDAGFRKAYAAVGDAVAIGMQVCSAREKEKLSKRKLALAAGVTVATVTAIEEGDSTATADEMSCVFEVLAGPLREQGIDVQAMIQPGARQRLREATQVVTPKPAPEPLPGNRLRTASDERINLRSGHAPDERVAGELHQSGN